MVLTETPRDTKGMSKFGQTLYSLMVKRGVETRQRLLRLLNDNGYQISQPRLSYYLNGSRNVDPMFMLCVSRLLGLTKEEQRELAWAYSYGQVNLTGEQKRTVEGFKDVL